MWRNRGSVSRESELTILIAYSINRKIVRIRKKKHQKIFCYIKGNVFNATYFDEFSDNIHQSVNLLTATVIIEEGSVRSHYELFSLSDILLLGGCCFLRSFLTIFTLLFLLVHCFGFLPIDTTSRTLSDVFYHLS